MYKDLKDNLIAIQHDLPRQQQKVCKYVIENLDDTSTMTIQELSNKSDVGTTTILRFIEKLGYEKYPDFKNSIIRYNYNNKKNTWWHLKKSLEENDDEENSLIKVGNSSIRDIETMIRELDVKKYDTFLHLLLQSKKVYFLGLRTSKSAALYFEMMLGEILDDMVQLSWDADFMYDKSLKFTEDDTLVVIALSPYSKQCIDFVKYCRYKSNISIALITDIETCPIIGDCDTHLVVGQSKNRYSILPAITLMESMIIDLGKNQPASISNISQLNDIHQENHITTI